MRPLIRAVRSGLAIAVLSAILLIVPSVGGAQVIPVGPFRSVVLRDGGRVIVRHGASQRVTLPEGAADWLSATVVDGDRLVITGRHESEREHDLARRADRRGPRRMLIDGVFRRAVEVETPDIEDIVVMDGGTIETRGSFPRQAKLRVAVEQGGTIDLRSLAVDDVTAAVRQGGRILTRPQQALNAEIVSGGIVTYWGNPNVRASVIHGGGVYRGEANDANKPLDQLGPESSVVPPLPPVPPAPPTASMRGRSTI